MDGHDQCAHAPEDTHTLDRPGERASEPVVRRRLSLHLSPTRVDCYAKEPAITALTQSGQGLKLQHTAR